MRVFAFCAVVGALGSTRKKNGTHTHTPNLRSRNRKPSSKEVYSEREREQNEETKRINQQSNQM